VSAENRPGPPYAAEIRFDDAGLVTAVVRDVSERRQTHAKFQGLLEAAPDAMIAAIHRPILAALGVFVLFAGLVFGGWVLAVGLVFTIISLLGWLSDARKEYRQVVRADETGHLENEPPPEWPKVVVPVFAVLVIVAVALNAGWFPPRSAAGGDAGAGASAAPSGGPAGSGAPGPGGLAITAQGIKFNVATLTAPADKPFTVTFDNKDAGTSHDFDVTDASGAKVFDGKDFAGPAVKTYDVAALKAGTYKFFCSIHPALMNGVLTVGG